MTPIIFTALTIVCSYQISGAPFVSVSFQDTDGQLSPEIQINHFGQVHSESLTAVNTAPDEMIHAWISKENPQNALEMIIYRSAQGMGRSKLINPNVPAPAQVVWGDCQ